MGNEAWVLSYREECFDQIGLKPSIKIPVYNGSLECEFRKYAIFDGSLKDFRQDGGVVKSDDEKRQMAEKNRFKKNREFKKRIDEDGSQDTDDIRSYTFKNHFAHTEERNDDRKRKRTASFNDRDDKRGGRSFERGGKAFSGKAKDFNRKGKSFERTDKRGSKNFGRNSANFIDHDD